MRTALAAALGMVLVTGCSIPTGEIRAEHFRFVTINQYNPEKPSGGWREACVQAYMKNGNTGESFRCQFGVGMPLKTIEEGEISTPLAQRIAADCANYSAYLVLMTAKEDTLPGMACTEFRNTFKVVLGKAIKQSRVTQQCDERTTPVIFGEP